MIKASFVCMLYVVQVGNCQQIKNKIKMKSIHLARPKKETKNIAQGAIALD